MSDDSVNAEVPRLAHEPFFLLDIHVDPDHVPEGWAAEGTVRDDTGHVLIAVYDPERYRMLAVPRSVPDDLHREMERIGWECHQVVQTGTVWFYDMHGGRRGFPEPAPTTPKPAGIEVPGL